jgi:type II secretory pathway pseudopilin PulG
MGIIAILMGLLFPAVNSVQESARRVQATTDVVNMSNAIIAYESEYGRLPLPSGSSGDIEASHPELFAILTAKNDDLNPRRLSFLDVPRAKNGKNGTNEAGEYLDSWGTAYLIKMDGDYDNEISPPSGSGDKDEIRKRVLVWSIGNPKRQSDPAKAMIKSWQ